MPGIVERLKSGTMLGAEGYVFELERRGYIKAGPYVPEVVLDFPGAVRELHREFLRAGSDVMVAPGKCLNERRGVPQLLERVRAGGPPDHHLAPLPVGSPRCCARACRVAAGS